jgi:adenosine kinase
VCAALISNHDRSLVPNLQAANNYKVDHLRLPHVWEIVEKAKFYYIEGFFYTVSPPTIMEVARHAAQHNKVFAMNLSAPFISQFYTQVLDDSAPYWDILIGNEAEAAAYCTAHNLDLVGNEAIAKHLSALPKANAQRERIVVLTHGPDRTVVSVGGRDAKVYPVPRVPSDEIVDSNGCGDAFVGGFLSTYIKGEDLDRCVEVGHWLASQVIRMDGAQYPVGLTIPPPSHE